MDDVQAPGTAPGLSEARAYLQAKAALAEGDTVLTRPAARMTATRQHMTATRGIVPGRQHAGAAPARRGHQVETQQDTHASA